MACGKNKCKNGCNCSTNVNHFFEKELPQVLCPHSLYFIKPLNEVTLYVTDLEGNPYQISSGGTVSDINIQSPQGTIIVTKVGNAFNIDLANSQGEINNINTITFNGDLLIPDANKNVSIDAVVSVTGNLVDNTDPNNPEVNFEVGDYDLEQFTNESDNPFLRESDLVNEHNSLTGKQGGDDILDEFYHLKEGEHLYLTDIVENDTIGLILNAIAVHPTYVPPTSSITNVTQTAEVGSTVNINISQTFTQNDAGLYSSQTIKKDGTTVSTTSGYSETLTVPTTNTVYSGTVTYTEGVTKNNNLGIPDPVGKILAGTVTSPNRTVSPIYPVFFGKFTTQPTAAGIDFAGMTKTVINSNGTISLNVASASSEYVAIAIPATSTIKTKWFVTELNQGAIGGTVNLFGTPTTALKNSPSGYWGGISYRIYITNYQSAINTIELRN